MFSGLLHIDRALLTRSRFNESLLPNVLPEDYIEKGRTVELLEEYFCSLEAVYYIILCITS